MSWMTFSFGRRDIAGELMAESISGEDHKFVLGGCVKLMKDNHVWIVRDT